MKILEDDVICTTELARRLGLGPQLNSRLLLSLGLKPLGRTKNGIYWRVSDIPAVCTALQRHLEEVKNSGGYCGKI